MEKDPGLEIYSAVVTYITWVFVILFCFFWRTDCLLF